MDLYQVYSNGSPGIQNGPGAEGLWFKNEIYLKIFFSRTAWAQVLEIWYVVLPGGRLPILFKQSPKVQDGPATRGPRFEP